jgi:hypothetical protein
MPTPRKLDEFAPTLDQIFKFAIGDVVASAALHQRWQADDLFPTRKADGGGPLFTAVDRYVVTQRLLIQCYGGIQACYDVSNELGQTLKFFEYALVPASEIDATQRERAKEHRIQEGERDAAALDVYLAAKEARRTRESAKSEEKAE